MPGLTVVRKKTMDMKEPFIVYVDGEGIGTVENGGEATFKLSAGEHSICISTYEGTDYSQVGALAGGLIGMGIGKLFNSAFKKSAKKNKKNEVTVSLNENTTTKIICTAGAFNAVIKEVSHMG